MRRTIEMLETIVTDMNKNREKFKQIVITAILIESAHVKLNAFVGTNKTTSNHLTPESTDWGDVKLIENLTAHTGTERTFKGNYVYIRADPSVGDGSTYDHHDGIYFTDFVKQLIKCSLDKYIIIASLMGILRAKCNWR